MRTIRGVIASTPKLIRASLRCRYVVVALEEEWLDKHIALPPYEIDDFDVQARTVHFVAILSEEGES